MAKEKPIKMEDVVQVLIEAMEEVQFGSVTLVIQDGKPFRVDVEKKIRI